MRQENKEEQFRRIGNLLIIGNMKDIQNIDSELVNIDPKSQDQQELKKAHSVYDWYYTNYIESCKDSFTKNFVKNTFQEQLNLYLDGEIDTATFIRRILLIIKSANINLYGNNLIEGSSGTPIAASSAISSKDRADLVNLYQDLRKAIDTKIFNIDFQQDRIYITRVMDSQIGWDYTPYQETIPENTKEKFNYTPYIASILEYMIDQGKNILPLPEIKIKEDEQEASNFFGKTAYYNPNEKEVVLYTLGRHPKDVCRSFTHEMIHHIQNLEGRLGGIGTSNTNEDDYLREIEKEAYLEGNMCFRNWEDGLKNKEVMAEGRYDKISNQASSDLFRGWKEAFDVGEKSIGFEESYSNGDVEFDVEGTLVLAPGTGKMEVLDSTGAGFDEDGDFIIANIAIDPELLPEFWEEISMTLKDLFRHEIEHLTHNRGGLSSNPAKTMQGDLARRDRMRAGELSFANYFKLKKEVDANLQGMLFRAKKEKRPFADVVNDYLDAQDITPKEKQEIIKIWRKRMPALGIRQSL